MPLKQIKQKIKEILKDNYTPLVFCIIYTAIFSAATILRYETFHSSFMDLGVEMQAIYDIANGHFTYYKSNIIIGSSYIEPFYFIMGLLYKLAPHVSFFLILQSFAIGISGFPFYWIYKKLIGNNGAYIAPLLLLLNPQIHTGNMFDFHISMFYVPFISFALYFAMSRKYFLLYLFSFLILFTKIDSFIYLSAICLYMILIDYKNKHNYILLAISIVYGLSGIFIVLPLINHTAYNLIFGNGTSDFGPLRYPVLSYGIKDLLNLNILGFLKTLFVPFSQNIYIYFKFILYFLIALLFLPLFSGKYLLIVIPSFLVNYLVNYPFQSMIMLQYVYYMIPFFVLASIYGIKNIKSKRMFNKIENKPNNKYYFNILLLFLLIGATFIIQNYSEINPDKNVNIFDVQNYIYYKKLYAEDYTNALKKIPKNATVSISEFAYPWDYMQKHVYLFPQVGKNTQYIVVSTCVKEQLYGNKDEKRLEVLKHIINKKKFTIIYNKGCSVILKKLFKS
jgi:uncharacterized membrane protein